MVVKKVLDQKRYEQNNLNFRKVFYKKTINKIKYEEIRNKLNIDKLQDDLEEQQNQVTWKEWIKKSYQNEQWIWKWMIEDL